MKFPTVLKVKYRNIETHSNFVDLCTQTRSFRWSQSRSHGVLVVHQRGGATDVDAVLELGHTLRNLVASQFCCLPMAEYSTST